MHQQNTEDLIFEKGWGAEKTNYSSAYVRIPLKPALLYSSLLLATKTGPRDEQGQAE